jgi:chromosome segregation ATPase
MHTHLSTVARGLVAAGLMSLSLASGAADPADRRVEQMREMARQAQQALQQSQAEQAKLQAEKATLAGEQTRLSQSLSAAEAKARAGSAREQRLQASLTELSAERDRLKQELAAQADALAKAQLGLDSSATQLSAAQRVAAEQRQTTATVTALLERSVQSLEKAEAANRELLRLGLQAADAYARETPEGMRSRDNPVGGFAAVRIEGRAEELRRDMARQRIKP